MGCCCSFRRRPEGTVLWLVFLSRDIAMLSLARNVQSFDQYHFAVAPLETGARHTGCPAYQYARQDGGGVLTLAKHSHMYISR
jgi:hypothetical protein